MTFGSISPQEVLDRRCRRSWCQPLPPRRRVPPRTRSARIARGRPLVEVHPLWLSQCVLQPLTHGGMHRQPRDLDRVEPAGCARLQQIGANVSVSGPGVKADGEPSCRRRLAAPAEFGPRRCARQRRPPAAAPPEPALPGHGRTAVGSPRAHSPVVIRLTSFLRHRQHSRSAIRLERRNPRLPLREHSQQCPSHIGDPVDVRVRATQSWPDWRGLAT
jgi:hypothetical protein